MQNHRPDRYPEHTGISQPGSCHSGRAAVLHGTRKRQKTANLGFGGAVSNRELLPGNWAAGPRPAAGPCSHCQHPPSSPGAGGRAAFPKSDPPRAASSEAQAHGRSLPAASAGLGALGILLRLFLRYPRFGRAAPGWRSLLPPHPTPSTSLPAPRGCPHPSTQLQGDFALS